MTYWANEQPSTAFMARDYEAQISTLISVPDDPAGTPQMVTMDAAALKWLYDEWRSLDSRHAELLAEVEHLRQPLRCVPCARRGARS